MDEIYETYKDALDFYIVYIREAHPTDVWPVFPNIDDDVHFAEPIDEEELSELAGV